MPYTLAHPAAGLLLRLASRGRLRLAALVIGSASPDFQYFLALTTEGLFAHSLPGLMLVCLPASWIVLWLYDCWGREGVQAFLPASWRVPLPPTPARPWWPTSLAILLGAGSHVLWDSFTHVTGWAVEVFPLLSLPVLPEIPLYRVLQHVSTFIGLSVIGLACVSWARTQPKVEWQELYPRIGVFVLMLGTAGLLNGLRFLHAGFPQFVVSAGVAVTLSFGIIVLVTGWWSVRAARPHPLSVVPPASLRPGTPIMPMNKPASDA